MINDLKAGSNVYMLIAFSSLRRLWLIGALRDRMYNRDHLHVFA